MDANDKKTLLQRTSAADPSPIDVKGYDGKIAKDTWEKENWNDGVAHRKNVLGDPK
ncbi:MAG: hypothetical protein ABR985_00635 [Methanotrichaceae archaeon]|jgi:hypothetical protein